MFCVLTTSKMPDFCFLRQITHADKDSNGTFSLPPPSNCNTTIILDYSVCISGQWLSYLSHHYFSSLCNWDTVLIRKIQTEAKYMYPHALRISIWISVPQKVQSNKGSHAKSSESPHIAPIIHCPTWQPPQRTEEKFYTMPLPPVRGAWNPSELSVRCYSCACIWRSC